MRTDARQTRDKHRFAMHRQPANSLLDRVCRLTENSHLRAQAGLAGTFNEGLVRRLTLAVLPTTFQSPVPPLYGQKKIA